MDAADEKNEHGSSRESTPAIPETLIAGRQKRSTAGNRLAQLLEQEQPDDIDLLFEEGEEDGDFEGKDESDVDLGSSSDEEDKPQEQDELAGEKELERQEREGRKKRKATDAFPNQKQLDKLIQRQQNVRNKRVTIQEPGEPKEDLPDSPNDDANRHRKKSERILWIPTQEDQPSRQSSRRQTVANKQLIHERMKESNQRRLKVIAAMNEASQKKKEQRVEMTQEMRLERAKKVEEKNKKSLNKWQVAEEARLEAQRAKLAALHNRKITGPVIRFYSGRAEWDENDHLVSLGKQKLVKEIPKVDEEKKPKEVPAAESKEDTIEKKSPDGDVVMEDVQPEVPAELNPPTEGREHVEGNPMEEPKETEESKVFEESVTQPDGVEDAMDVEVPTEAEGPIEASAITEEVEAAEKATEVESAENSEEAVESKNADEPKEPEADATVSTTEAINDNNPPLPESSLEAPVEAPTSGDGETARISVAPPSPTGFDDDTQNKIAEQIQGDLDAAAVRPAQRRVTSQVYVVLQNFKKDAVSSKEVQGKVLFPHNHGSLPKPDRPLCVTTNLPARFRDPVTGLPYASLFGYKQIQRVKTGNLRWNNTLQCFFDGQEAASGVPEGFY